MKAAVCVAGRRWAYHYYHYTYIDILQWHLRDIHSEFYVLPFFPHDSRSGPTNKASNKQNTTYTHARAYTPFHTRVHWLRYLHLY